MHIPRRKLLLRAAETAALVIAAPLSLATVSRALAEPARKAPGAVCHRVHYLVRAVGQNPLVTQVCFGTDKVFEGDPDRNFTRDPLITGRALVRPVTMSGAPQAVAANVTFDLVLETA